MRSRSNGSPTRRRFNSVSKLALILLCAAWIHAPIAVGTQTYDIEYLGVVNDYGGLIQWVQDAHIAATSPTGLDDWENDNLVSTATDAVAVFCLGLNQNATLDSTQHTVLTHGSSGHELATYYQISSDGDGSTASGITGAGNGVDSFIYVGGGSSAWETANEPGGAGTFLGIGKTVSYVTDDTGTMLTVTVRGHNGEDFDSASDSTEAPDAGSYTADLTLRAQ